MHSIACDDEMSMDYAKEQLKSARENWKALKKEGEELREKCLLDHHLKELAEDQMQEKGKKS